MKDKGYLMAERKKDGDKYWEAYAYKQLFGAKRFVMPRYWRVRLRRRPPMFNEFVRRALLDCYRRIGWRRFFMLDYWRVRGRRRRVIHKWVQALGGQPATPTRRPRRPGQRF